MKTQECDFLIYDISSVLYRTFFADKNETDETLAGLAVHAALNTLNKYFKLYKPRKKVVMAFDRSSWRKEYTASEQCISKKPYKGNRRKDMTPAQQAKYQRFLNHINEFEQLIADHTTIITLLEERLEADDLIAGFCQKYANEENEIIIISSDSDLLQLVAYPNVRVVSPADGEDQSLEEYNNDPDLYLFTKCIRGDPTDNVQSAYPRISSKKIREAYTDPFARVQLLKSTWTNEQKIEFVVEKLYAENRILIDLGCQPENIQQLIKQSIESAFEKKRQFSMFFILKFIGKYKLNRIKDSIDQYVPLLSR